MGRRESPLDPDAGPLAHFAVDLRQLRREAGPIGYRELAARAHYSTTTLSQAAGGEVLPTLEVTLAYVKACGGDESLWRERWHTVAALVAEGRLATAPDADASPAPSTDPAGAGSPESPAGRLRRAARPLGRFGRPRWIAYGTVSAAVLVAVLVAASAGSASYRTARTLVRPSSPATSASELDGHDPKDTHCADDAVAAASAALQLTSASVFGSRTLPAGTVIGTVELRYSPRCRTAWGKLKPAGIVDYPAFGSVVIEAIRPATGTTLHFAPGRLEQVYGDMLLTGPGCVYARGTIKSVAGVTVTAATGCRTAPPSPPPGTASGSPRP